jgi:hypothetical protein
MPPLVKPYMLRTNDMSKVIVSIGWNNDFVMDADKALTFRPTQRCREVPRGVSLEGREYLSYIPPTERVGYSKSIEYPYV